MVWSALTGFANRTMNKEEFEAIVAAGIKMAGANGTIEPREVQELKDALDEQENMKPFAEQIHATIMEYKDKLETNRGRTFLNKQLLDISGKDISMREGVMGIALDVAGALDPEEIAVAKEIAGLLNVDPKKFRGLA